MQLQRWTPSPSPARSSTLAIVIAVATLAGSGQVSAVEAMDDPTEPSSVTAAAIAPRIEWQTPDQAFSPDGDGADDTLTVEFRLSEPATGLIVVLDASGIKVATLRPVEVAVTQDESAPIIVRATWGGMTGGAEDVDASPASPGRYRVEATFTDPVGNAVTTAVRTELLDVSPGEIVRPGPGAAEAGRTVFAVAAADHDGIAINAVSFWPLGVDGPVRDGAPASVEDGHWQAIVDLGSLVDQGSVSEGESVSADAFVYWADRFGKMHTYRTKPVSYRVEAEPASLVVVGQSPDRQFSPNGDGVEDSIAATAEFSLPVAVTATVRDSAGAMVRRLAAAAGQSVRAVWDGTDAAGRPAPTGEYRIRIEGTAADGVSAVAVIRVAIDRRAPAALRFPTAGETIAGVTSLVLDATPGFDLKTVRFGPFGSEAAAYAVSRPEPDGTWVLAVETSAFNDGSIYFEPVVLWKDRFGQGHRSVLARTEFVVDNAGAEPVALVSVSPSRSFSPNADGFEDRFAASFTVSERVDASVTVVDAFGKVVRHLEGRWLDDTKFEIGWDGADDGGRPSPSGRYRVQFDAVDTYGNHLQGAVETDVLYRLPGRLVAPVSGPVTSDRFEIVVAPTNGTNLSSVSISPFGLDLTRSEVDGRWSGEMATGDLSDAEYGVIATLRWSDRFGSEHIYNTPVANIQVSSPKPTRNTAPMVGFIPADGERQVRYGDSILALSVAASDIDGDRIDLELLEPLVPGVELGPVTCDLQGSSNSCQASLVGVVAAGLGEYTIIASARDSEGGVGQAAYDLNVSPRPVTFEVGPLSYDSERNLGFTLELAATAGDLANADLTAAVVGEQAQPITCSVESGDVAPQRIALRCTAADVAAGAGTLVVTSDNEFFVGRTEVAFDLVLPDGPGPDGPHPPVEIPDPDPETQPKPLSCERTVVRFDDFRLLNTDGSSASDLHNLSLGCARYQVRLEGRDDLHEPGYQTDQTGEQWFLEAYDSDGNLVYQSPPTEDLADDETYSVFVIPSVDLTGVVAVRARHHRGTNAIDSIDPRLVLLPID